MSLVNYADGSSHFDRRPSARKRRWRDHRHGLVLAKKSGGSRRAASRQPIATLVEVGAIELSPKRKLVHAYPLPASSRPRCPLEVALVAVLLRLAIWAIPAAVMTVGCVLEPPCTNQAPESSAFAG